MVEAGILSLVISLVINIRALVRPFLCYSCQFIIPNLVKHLSEYLYNSIITHHRAHTASLRLVTGSTSYLTPHLGKQEKYVLTV